MLLPHINLPDYSLRELSYKACLPTLGVSVVLLLTVAGAAFVINPWLGVVTTMVTAYVWGKWVAFRVYNIFYRLAFRKDANEPAAQTPHTQT